MMMFQRSLWGEPNVSPKYEKVSWLLDTIQISKPQEPVCVGEKKSEAKKNRAPKVVLRCGETRWSNSQVR